jgi:hypothetical protein
MAQVLNIDVSDLRVICARKIPSGGAKGQPWAPAVYEPRWSVSGRAWRWALIESHLLGVVFGKDGKRREAGRWSQAAGEREAEAIAFDRGIDVALGVVNNALIDDYEILATLQSRAAVALGRPPTRDWYEDEDDAPALRLGEQAAEQAAEQADDLRRELGR